MPCWPYRRFWNFGHFLRGSVDWNRAKKLYYRLYDTSLPSRKCGLKSIYIKDLGNLNRHFLRGSVDWNNARDWCQRGRNGHFLRGSVDWNLNYCNEEFDLSLSLPSRKCGLKWCWKRQVGNGISSLPSRKCGLKFMILVIIFILALSLPSRKCGLK